MKKNLIIIFLLITIITGSYVSGYMVGKTKREVQTVYRTSLVFTNSTFITDKDIKIYSNADPFMTYWLILNKKGGQNGKKN